MNERAARSIVTIAFALGVTSLAQARPRPFQPRDLWAMQRISSPCPSPDGRWVVYAVRSFDVEANKGASDLWLVGIDGKGERQLTTDPANDTDPRWAPDGKSIYFLSRRGGSAQVWRLPIDGGEAKQVTDLPIDVQAFDVHPDGKRLIVALEVFVDCNDVDCTKKRLDEKETSKATGRLYTQVFVRRWDTWEDGRRQHLFAVPVAGGKAIDLMKGMDADAPPVPWGSMDDVAVTPDGKSLVFTAKDAGREEAWSTNDDLFLVPLDGSAKPRNLTAANKGSDVAPSFSPDGKSLAWLSMPRAMYESDRRRVMVAAWTAAGPGAAREVAPEWDRSADELAWSADGKTLFATADHLGHHGIFAIDVARGSVRDVVTDGSVGSVSFVPAAGAGKLVFGLDHLRSPVELYTVGADGKELLRITHANDAIVADLEMGAPEQFSFKGAGGDTVYGWITRPVGFKKGVKYPLAFLIHGGPQGSMGNHFHYRWNPQVYAGRGYVAVMIDFHGSTGYGQKFTDAIQGDWGGKPLEDL
jgi:dipeptidyl aminopeptidase/acylaminoacyl peptidase